MKNAIAWIFALKRLSKRTGGHQQVLRLSYVRPVQQREGEWKLLLQRPQMRPLGVQQGQRQRDQRLLRPCGL